jgi:hypothetical protein
MSKIKIFENLVRITKENGKYVYLIKIDNIAYIRGSDSRGEVYLEIFIKDVSKDYGHIGIEMNINDYQIFMVNYQQLIKSKTNEQIIGDPV